MVSDSNPEISHDMMTKDSRLPSLDPVCSLATDAKPGLKCLYHICEPPAVTGASTDQQWVLRAFRETEFLYIVECAAFCGVH